jgi:hypothetical protein
MMPAADTVKWQASLRIDRYTAEQTTQVREQTGVVAPIAEDFAFFGIKPETTVVGSNLLTTAGLTRLTSLLTGGGGQALTNTACRLGLGNGAGSAVVGDTDLGATAGSTNRWFQIMDATYPTVAAGVITFRATFGTADGNFAWNEWGIDVGAPTVTSGNTVAALLFNHKTSIAQGTKASGQTWVATATITIS